MNLQHSSGYTIDEDNVLVDMWNVPVCHEICERLGHEWSPMQECARSIYLKGLIVVYRELEEARTSEENKQAILNLRDAFSKSELLDLYQNGKYLP